MERSIESKQYFVTHHYQKSVQKSYIQALKNYILEENEQIVCLCLQGLLLAYK
jgi:hypothetical protein